MAILNHMDEPTQLPRRKDHSKVQSLLTRCGLAETEISDLLAKVAEPRPVFTVEDILPEDYVVDVSALCFCLEYLLHHLPAAEVGGIVQSCDIHRLARRLLFVYRLCNPRLPSYTHDDLAHLLLDTEQHLQANRRSLLATGYPQTRFTKSPWLDELITDLYRTKLPLRVVQTSQESGQVKYGYVWCDRSLGFPLGAEQNFGAPFFMNAGERLEPHTENPAGLEPTAPVQEVSYGHAPPMRGLPLEKAYLLERGRPYVLATKTEVLRSLRDALSSGKADGLWDACCEAMRKHISGNEAGFFFNMDRPDFWATNEKTAAAPRRLVCGGLSTLMHVVGQCEQELRVGVMHRTRMALGSLFAMDERGNKGLRPSGSWLEEKEGLVIDNAISQYRDLQPAMTQFADEFSTRVMKELNVQLREVVVVEARVKRDDKRRVHAAASSYLKHLEVVTEAGLPSGPVLATDAEKQPTFRQEGKKWRVCFGGTAVWVNDSAGMVYLKVLLDHPHEGFVYWRLEDIVHPSGADGSALKKRGFLSDHSDDDGSNIGWSIEGVGTQEVFDGKSMKELKAEFDSLRKSRDKASTEDEAKKFDIKIRELAKLVEPHIKGKGKSRRIADPAADKLTDTVSTAIRRAIASIRKVHPGLGRHLHNAVSRGITFAYRPEMQITWNNQ